MGSIISAIELDKRVIVMPRRAALGEHRNEHQLATVARLSHLRGFEVVHAPQELHAALEYNPARIHASAPAGADPGLLAAIRGFAGLESA
jgi:UDP-N-acetylglucosamine transferase subunit ALG13